MIVDRASNHFIELEVGIPLFPIAFIKNIPSLVVLAPTNYNSYDRPPLLFIYLLIYYTVVE